MPLLYRCNGDLADADDGVATGQEVPVPQGSQGEEDDADERCGGCDPEGQGPVPPVLQVRHRGDGEHAAEVVGDEEVAEEGRLGLAFAGVGLVELVSAEGGDGGLVGPVPQGDLVYGDVEDERLGSCGWLAVFLPPLSVCEVAGSRQEHMGCYGKLNQSLALDLDMMEMEKERKKEKEIQIQRKMDSSRRGRLSGRWCRPCIFPRMSR